MTQPTGVLELKVLAILLRRKTYLKYKDILKTEFFKTSELKILFRAIVKIHEKFKKPRVFTKDVWLLIEKRIDEEDYSRFKKLLLKIRYLVKNIGENEEEIIHFSIIRFAQENTLKGVLGVTVQDLQAGNEVDFSELKTQLDKIIALDGIKKVKDYEYLKFHAERVDPEQEPYRLPTGISGELDKAMSGGIAAGELGFFLAPPGRGKTLALVNVGANAMRQGKKVLHFTLEINARNVGKRYDSCLCQTTYSEIREDPSILMRKMKEIRDRGGSLGIRDYSYSYCSISELNSIMEERYERGSKVDLLIVDYGDLLMSQQRYKESRFEINKTYEELRVISGYFKVPVWTASQANRAALSKPSVDMRDIAEAFGKANTADIIIALSQTEEEKVEKEMRLAIVKNRLGETNPTISVVSDLSRMILRPANSYDVEEHWIKPNLSKIRERSSDGKDSSDRPRLDKNRDSNSKSKKRKTKST